jgi:thioredoxin
MSQVVKLTAVDFPERVLRADGTVVVDFWAPWCRPCRRLAPAIERLAEERPDIVVAKLDVDAAPELAGRYGVRSIPTVIRFDRGRPTAVLSGALPYPLLRQGLRLTGGAQGREAA